jgi:hypothetical protein
MIKVESANNVAIIPPDTSPTILWLLQQNTQLRSRMMGQYFNMSHNRGLQVVGYL